MANGAHSDIAIVGMAAVFPGAADLGAYWNNIEAGTDSIREVPATRWDPVFFEPSSGAIDRFYWRHGGFIDEESGIDPVALGVMPVAARGAEPDQLLALALATQALRDAGESSAEISRDGIGVILGRGGYLTPAMARLSQRV